MLTVAVRAVVRRVVVTWCGAVAGAVAKARAVWPASAAEAAARPRVAGAWGGPRHAPSPAGALSGWRPCHFVSDIAAGPTG